MTIDEQYIAKAMELQGLIEYQDNTIVSKELVKKTTGTITLFAVDEGQGISEHSAPFDALVQVIDGEAIVTIGGENHVVRKDQMIIMPADIPHALKADQKFKMMLTMIKSE
ncbi:MAG: cupin domain-containing protein [Methanobrevibacter sp.]|uniref:cupin domain-containing protein n=1 Tax=Methanobrevibacter sp. TaxID=66852 RepID=UPI0026DF675C|nr:cupin domain-containing protein [Methanobrevibacter sp.]MDO5848740.1 cupin domain-containing protein [Methanobrevibacter sp.]